MGLSPSEFVSPPDPQDLLWQWERSGDRSYLVCGLLEQFTHGFFTKEWEGHKPKDLTQLWGQALKTYNLTQIHGNLMWETSEIDRDHIGEGDGLMSDRGGDCLWVASADCNPILIGDLSTGRVSAVHAGWRGTAQKIATVAVHKLIAAGSDLKDLRIAIGPAIDGEVYQVGMDVAIEVLSGIDLTVEEGLQRGFLLPDEDPAKIRLDVRKVNYYQLLTMGLQSEQIAIAPHCTYQQPGKFFSYRRTRIKQVQWSGILCSNPNLA